MRIETSGKYKIVCGHIYPTDELKPGQNWLGSSNHMVTIDSITDDWVTYSWYEDGVLKTHEKDAFSFQCRYCLIVEN